MSRWFTADQHFGDRQIIGLCQRPFGSVREQDDALVARWNEVVSPADEVWVLGDFAVDPLEETLARVHQLHGVKRLVVGNHDEPFNHPVGSPGQQRSIQRYLTAGFTSVHPGQIRIQLTGQPVLLTHFPVERAYFEQADRYAEHRPGDDGGIVVHGHVHDDWQTRTTRRGTRQIHVGVDMHDFAPVPEAQLRARLAELDADDGIME